MCLVDDMGRKKTVVIAVVIFLTLLNVWLVRNWMSSGVHRPYPQVRLRQKTGRKMSDILVIAVQDIHPIEHLEEARAMGITQTPGMKLGVDSGFTSYAGQSMTRPVAVDQEKLNNLKLKLENLKNQLAVNKLGVLR
ncbi:hypothetical protein Btru_060916 [Bulinus truncatus]|nr:hypothetical protein Btru_060916 [Bulinus truncatus]